MFKKISNWLKDEPPQEKPSKAVKTAGANSSARLTPSTSATAAADDFDENDPANLIRQAILEAQQTVALEEKIAGHNPEHLEAVQDAMMVYRRKQESLQTLPLEEQARLRALGEVMFGDQLSKAKKNAKKTH